MNTNTNIPKEIKTAIIGFLSGGLNPDEFEVLNKWIQESEENKKFFDQINDIWQATSEIEKKHGFDPNKAWDDIYGQINKKNRVFIPLKRINSEILRIAAVFVFALILGGSGFYFLNINKLQFSSQLVEYVAPLGSRSFLKLPDGTKVWLNAGTSVKYKNNYGVANRNITLTGEAFFDVAKNKNLPFNVETSAITITAIGTQFNVKAYSEENVIETTLIEGSVSLKTVNDNLKTPYLLKINEKAVFSKSTKTLAISNTTQKVNAVNKPNKTKPSLTILKSIDPKPIISWKDKRWIISNQKLSELSVKLERRYDVNFIFENESLKNYAFGGTLEDENLNQVMEVISLAAPIKYFIDKKNVYINEDPDKIKNYKNAIMK